jgi:plasmid stability protein
LHPVPGVPVQSLEFLAVNASNAYDSGVTLTLNNLPPNVDAALRQRASDRCLSVDEIAIEALQAGLGLAGSGVKVRDLSDLAGHWIEDPQFDAAILAQDQVDPDAWK